MKPDPILVAVGQVLIEERRFTHEQMKALEARIDALDVLRGAARLVIGENVKAMRTALEPITELRATILSGTAPAWVEEALK